MLAEHVALGLIKYIATACTGADYFGLSGVLRAMAAGTGFRASELASLTPASFHLDGDSPTIDCAAGYASW